MQLNLLRPQGFSLVESKLGVKGFFFHQAILAYTFISTSQNLEPFLKVNEHIYL